MGSATSFSKLNIGPLAAFFAPGPPFCKAISECIFFFRSPSSRRVSMMLNAYRVNPLYEVRSCLHIVDAIDFFRGKTVKTFRLLKGGIVSCVWDDIQSVQIAVRYASVTNSNEAETRV